MEIWKDITGFEGKYKVSNTGKILSIKNNIILKPLINKGYEYVQLRRRKSTAVHRIVAAEFIGHSSLSIDHIDCNPRNNKVENLQYVTIGENVKLSFSRGTAAIGSAKNQSKLIEKDIIDIRKMISDGILLRDIASKYNISLSAVSMIKRKRTWSHVR